MSDYSETAVAQFENVNSLRSYPFQDGCRLVDNLGRTLPQNVIVDLHMFVPVGIQSCSPRVSMTSVHLSQSMVSVCFVSEACGTSGALSVTVSADNLRPYVPYRLEKLVGSYDIGGVVTFGEMELPGFPETYLFDMEDRNAEVHPCCVSAGKPASLRSFIDRRSGNRVSGDVNISFSRHIESSKSGKSFRLSLSEGSASELMSKCSGLSESTDICGATPIRSINGVRPDADGNIVLWFH